LGLTGFYIIVRGGHRLPLFYPLGGIKIGLKGVYIFRGYATPPPLRRTGRGVAESRREGMTGGGAEVIYLHLPDCGGFGGGSCFI